MDTIDRLSEKLIKHYLGSSKTYSEFRDKVNNELLDINNEKYRIKLIKNLICTISKELEKHKKVCPTNGKDCQESEYYRDILFYLEDELYSYQYTSDNDFSFDEKIKYESRLEDIKEDLSAILAGQQGMYAKIMEEIDELKNLLFLDKRNWKNLFTGKLIDWVGSGLSGQVVANNILPHIEDLIKLKELLKLGS
jgi:hypothetical protein